MKLLSHRFTISPVLPFVLLLAGCELGLPTEEEPAGQGVISGSVADTANVLVPNATIAVRGAVTRNVVAAAGVYSVRDLAAGGYTVTMVPPVGYELAPNTNGTVPVQIVASETKTVNFRVRRTATTTSVPPQARK